MVRDYTGMVRYRWLLSQSMISAPYALQEDRGVTGGGNEMRIGDRAVSITGQSVLRPGSEQWQPVPR
jgi:defect-in-organelle-trafficking protein DotC